MFDVARQSMTMKRPQFAVKSLLLVVAAISIWLANLVRSVEHQQQALSIIHQYDGQVAFAEDLGGNLSLWPDPNKPRAKGGLPDDYFRTLAKVDLSIEPFNGPRTLVRPTDADLDVICDVRSIRWLSLWGTAVTDEGLASIGRLRNLEALDLHNPVTPNELWERLAYLGRLPRRDSPTGRLWPSDRQGWEQLLSQNKEATPYFVATKRPHGAAGRAGWQLAESSVPSAWLSRDEMIARGGPMITDAGLKHLAHIKSLRALSLAGNKITDRGLEAIARPRNLEELCLDDTEITDAGIRHLAGLPRLADLSICRTAVTDASAPVFRDMPSLKTVRTTGTHKGLDKSRFP